MDGRFKVWTVLQHLQVQSSPAWNDSRGWYSDLGMIYPTLKYSELCRSVWCSVSCFLVAASLHMGNGQNKTCARSGARCFACVKESETVRKRWLHPVRRHETGKWFRRACLPAACLGKKKTYWYIHHRCKKTRTFRHKLRWTVSERARALLTP